MLLSSELMNFTLYIQAFIMYPQIVHSAVRHIKRTTNSALSLILSQSGKRGPVLFFQRIYSWEFLVQFARYLLGKRNLFLTLPKWWRRNCGSNTSSSFSSSFLCFFFILIFFFFWPVIWHWLKSLQITGYCIIHTKNFPC